MGLDVALAPLLSAFVGAAVVTGAATPLVARLATRLGVVDQPGGRRVHDRATPRLGGVAVALGLLVGAVAYGVLFGLDALLAILTRDQLLAFLLPCLLVFLVGLVDDIRGLSPTSRLAVEAVAATFLVQAGYVIDNVANPFGDPIDLGLFAMPLTVMWLVGVTNAYNLIDGLDGLLGSVSFAALVGIAAVAFLGERSASGILAAALAGSVLGFLVWNWHPARIFMGDSGSLLIGFAIAALSIKVARNKIGAGTLALHVPLLLCGLPIAETLLTLARRHISGRPYFSGDRSHIHHVLLNKGLAVPTVVRALALISALLATVAVLSRNWREQAFLAGAVVVFALAVMALRWLGYLELKVLAARLIHALRHPRRADLARAVTAASVAESIGRATSASQLRQALDAAVADLQLDALGLALADDLRPLLTDVLPSRSDETGDVVLWVREGRRPSGTDGTVLVTLPLPPLEETHDSPGRLVVLRIAGSTQALRDMPWADELPAAVSAALGRLLALQPVTGSVPPHP